MADPRFYDGDPYEVAARAARQAEAVARVLATALDGAHVMARNAELERQLATTNQCDAAAWEKSAQSRRWEDCREKIAAVEQSLAVLVKAAGFNPKAKLDG